MCNSGVSTLRNLISSGTSCTQNSARTDLGSNPESRGERKRWFVGILLQLPNFINFFFLYSLRKVSSVSLFVRSHIASGQ